MRRDLRNTDGMKIPKGKIVAQCGHAYVALTLKARDKVDFYQLAMLNEWLKNSYTKICLGVDSEEELLALYNKAVDKGINAVLITDNGDTQFGGKKTITCMGIGPDLDTRLDEITGHLKSL